MTSFKHAVCASLWLTLTACEQGPTETTLKATAQQALVEPAPHKGPSTTAARLRDIKGFAIYRPLGDEQPKPHQVLEVEAPAGAGEEALVVVTQEQPQLVRLAVVRKTSSGQVPPVLPSGEFAAQATWITPAPFAFGGAVWDQSREFVVWGELLLGDRLAVSADGRREKVAFHSVTLKGAMKQGRGFTQASVLAHGNCGAPVKAAPLQYANQAVWPQSLKVTQGAGRERSVTLTFVVDSLVAPDYFGTDRPASDGRYKAGWLVRAGQWRLQFPPERQANYAFEGQWVNAAN